MMFAQEPIGEIRRAQTELADVHEHVKRASRFNDTDSRNALQAIDHVFASHVEFVAHVRDRLLVALECGQRAFLRK